MSSEITRVLQQLQIATVYWVDDDHVKSTNLSIDKMFSEAVGVINTLGSEPIRKVIGNMPETLRPGLKQLMRTLDGDQTAEQTESVPKPDRTEMIASRLHKLVEEEDDARAHLQLLLDSVDGRLNTQQKAALTSLFSPTVGQSSHTWKKMSFSDWERQQSSILETHTANNPALVLLDQQNTQDESSLDGLAILKNVCNDRTNHSAFKFLVVTNTVNPDGEFEHAIDLANQIELTQPGIASPVFTVAKSRISRSLTSKPGDGPTLESHFVSLLQRLRLSLLNQELTELARGVIAEATERAFSRLRQITLHEFMYAVTQSSQIEGVSELDTLLRLLAIEQRDAMLSQVISSNPLRSAIEKIRDVPMDIRKDDIKKRADLKALRGREIYWPEQAVNKLHQPVAAGDIFEVAVAGGPKDYFVVLGNDCDLMLRSNGERNSVLVLLAKIEAGNGDKDLDATLECPLPQNELLVRVPMNKVISAPMDVLDLCWLNANGSCVWRKGDNHQAMHLLKSQKERAAILRGLLTSQPSLERVVAGAPFPLARKATTKSVKVDFKLRRVGRMNAPYAQGLLAKFASVFARPSYEHNYSNVRSV